MKLRRILTNAGLQTQTLRDGVWVPLGSASPLGPSPFTDEWQVATATRHRRLTDALLPFDPLSFRDFLLSERHNVNASRGMVKRFYPRTYAVSRAYERIRRRTFPGFKPKPLFYESPIYYSGNAMTIVPTRTPVAFPSFSRGLDFELELALVLRAPLLDASAASAIDAIGGFVVLNDFSARDVQRDEMKSGLGPQKSKHFISSMSATAVTADEVLPRFDTLTGSVIVNGRRISTVSTRDLRWGLGDLLARASRDEQLLPGELISTGTLTGGSGMEIDHWLSPGDTLTLTLDGIGDVEHQIVEHPARRTLAIP